MSRRIMISLAAAALLGTSFISISSDASARVYRGVGRVGVAHVGVYRGAVVRRGVGIGVGGAAVGAAAYGACRAWQCGPYGACGWIYTC